MYNNEKKKKKNKKEKNEKTCRERRKKKGKRRDKSMRIETQQNFVWNKTKILGKHKTTFSKRRYDECSLMTIVKLVTVTFLKKRY